MTDRTVDPSFAVILIEWQQCCGRHDLPWQNTRDPYRVWLSEVMLQQTQVLTVRDYFTRFLARFPDVGALARSHLDEVLGLWSGLGYYSRARNMHRCAQQVMALHAGSFPQTALQLQTLPGIGRSTAAAIASICFGERVAIMDGNVKRVLTRYLGFAADLALAVNERVLWQEAHRLLPLDNLHQSMPRYTQAVMDLGATVCTSKKPDCGDCPLQRQCQAKAMGRPDQFPVMTRKRKRSAQTLWMLWAESDDGALWLSQRPTPGVWAGLYCFALFEERDSLQAAVSPDWQAALQEAPVVKHVLTHKDLYLHPVRVRLPRECCPGGQGAWIESGQWPGMGLPAPVRKLLDA
jgi:A/G-specific adenine glycosylase